MLPFACTFRPIQAQPLSLSIATEIREIKTVKILYSMIKALFEMNIIHSLEGDNLHCYDCIASKVYVQSTKFPKRLGGNFEKKSFTYTFPELS